MEVPAESNRQPLDTSTPTSTAINRYIRETELGEHIINGSTSTAQTSAYEPDKSEQQLGLPDVESILLRSGTGSTDENLIENVKVSHVAGVIDHIEKLGNQVKGEQNDDDKIDKNDKTHEFQRESEYLLTNSQKRLNPIQEEEHMSKLKSIENLQENNSSILDDASPNRIIKPSRYQEKLLYLPNSMFHVDKDSSMAFALEIQDSPFSSIPNTFKYKSHPNAKTKATLGGTRLKTVDRPSGSEETNMEDNSEPIKTSTIRENHVDTPDWMPEELDDKWDEPKSDFLSSVRITKRDKTSSDPVADLDLEFPSGNTILHNSKFSSLDTPAWKRAVREQDQKAKLQPNFQNIFLSLESQHDKSDNVNANNHSVSSTFSTPMATISHQNLKQSDKDDRNNKNKIAEDVNQQGSPLKLFGTNYNTFTKEKLSGVLQKFHQLTPPEEDPKNKGSDEIDVQHKEDDSLNLQNEHSEIPRLKIKNFTRSKNYTEEHFIQNANNVYNNIQKRGFKPAHDEGFRSMSNAHTTATSTPKSHKLIPTSDPIFQDDNSSFTSDFDEESSDYKYQQFNSDAVNNDYTSYDHSTNNGASAYPHAKTSSIPDVSEHSDDSSYTFDDVSLTSPELQKPRFRPNSKKQAFTNDQNNLRSQQAVQTRDVIENSEAHVNSDLMHLVEILKNENDRLKQQLQSGVNLLNETEVSLDNADFTSEGVSQLQDLIRWKRASQLHLPTDTLPSSHSIEKNSDPNTIIRGRIKPGVDLPVAYDNMVLDVKNQKWVASENKENYPGSLDSIEDLVTNSTEFPDVRRPLSKPNSNNIMTKNLRPNSSKLEVSFQLPHSDQEKDRTRSPINAEVTSVSQLDEITFSQTRKKLVSIINDILSLEDTINIPWDEINEISLSNRNLDSIKDLDTFLPSLISVDLSQNELKYLEGLPKSILNIDLSENRIENITPFHRFRDLQYLDISSNNLVTLSNFSKNIHLTNLNASKNQLNSLSGLQTLVNLAKFNASQNELSGLLDFDNYFLPNLQELNLSENSLQSISGLETLSNLRVLNVNENKLFDISCRGKHPHLKKLLLKFNQLEKLDVLAFPFLRVLRVDGNDLRNISGLLKLKHLDELSCKAQRSVAVIEEVFRHARDVQSLDLSGNMGLTLSGYNFPFLNLNKLELTALDWTRVPDNFAAIFPNVRDLNLNFNRLTNIDGLAKLTNLRKVYLVSNKIQRTETVVTGLLGSRSSLRLLDLRLNLCNIDLYPYVFSPDELEYAKVQNYEDCSPIHLDNLEDIESFAIHYKSLSKGVDEWTERDSQFINKLSIQSTLKVRLRLNYETLLINYFRRLSRLDGGHVSDEKRRMMRVRLNQNEVSEIL